MKISCGVPPENTVSKIILSYLICNGVEHGRSKHGLYKILVCNRETVYASGSRGINLYFRPLSGRGKKEREN